MLVLSLSVQAADPKGKKDKKKNEQPALPAEPDQMVIIKKDRPLLTSPSAHLPYRRQMVIEGVEGIDVSHYQGTINWAELAASKKVSYCIVKATESNYFVDDYYYYNIQEGRKNGIAMGSYHFFRANVGVEEQFRHMISIIDAKDQDIVPMIDVETANGVSPEALASRLHRFMKMVEDYYGRPPILYTYVKFYNRYIAQRGFEHYPLMIASYTETLPCIDGDQDYIIWQYSSKGRIKGIRGDVDCSRFMNGHSIQEVLF